MTLARSESPHPSQKQHRGARRVAKALLGAIVAVLFVTQLVLANAYSPETYVLSLDPAGSEPDSDYCTRSGIIDTARNYSQAVVYVDSGDDCTGGSNTLPSGWIGVKAQGYRDGAVCGASSWYYSTSDSPSWQLWITLCTNPSGSQEFRTRSYLKAYDGSSDYIQETGPISPIQTY